jgi:hypothetical protein
LREISIELSSLGWKRPTEKEDADFARASEAAREVYISDGEILDAGWALDYWICQQLAYDHAHDLFMTLLAARNEGTKAANGYKDPRKLERRDYEYLLHLRRRLSWDAGKVKESKAGGKPALRRLGNSATLTTGEKTGVKCGRYRARTCDLTDVNRVL